MAQDQGALLALARLIEDFEWSAYATRLGERDYDRYVAAQLAGQPNPFLTDPGLRSRALARAIARRFQVAQRP